MSGNDRKHVCGLPTEVALHCGARIILRHVTEDDSALIRLGFENLSEESRLMRFLATRKNLSTREVTELVAPADADHATLGALTCEGGDPVGLARFIRLGPASRQAEFAITIVDRFQRQGVGAHMLRALAHVAQSCSIHQFVALVHAENRAMRCLLGRYGALHSRPATGDSEISLSVRAIVDHRH